MKKLLTRKIADQDMKCGICGEAFTNGMGQHKEGTIPTIFKRLIGDAILTRDQKERAEIRLMRLPIC
jgi:hypothetical protein